MKAKYFIHISIIFSLLFFSAVLQADEGDIAGNVTIKIKCPEMSCAGCKKKITRSINNLDGIEKVEVDLETKIITVTFDESKTSSEKIVGAIADAGYESELVK